jgi:hypothetical protein
VKSLLWFSDLLAVAFTFTPDDKLNTGARELTLETSTAELKVYLERVHSRIELTQFLGEVYSFSGSL